MTANLVALGQYKGSTWDSVPESYLYYIVNQAYSEGRSDMSFAEECRREVIRRRSRFSRTAQDPWAEKYGPLTELAYA